MAQSIKDMSKDELESASMALSAEVTEKRAILRMVNKEIADREAVELKGRTILGLDDTELKAVLAKRQELLAAGGVASGEQVGKQEA